MTFKAEKLYKINNELVIYSDRPIRWAICEFCNCNIFRYKLITYCTDKKTNRHLFECYRCNLPKKITIIPLEELNLTYFERETICL